MPGAAKAGRRLQQQLAAAVVAGKVLPRRWRLYSDVHSQTCLEASARLLNHCAWMPGAAEASEGLQEQLAAEAVKRALREALAASQRQTESAVNQLRDAQMRIDRLQVPRPQVQASPTTSPPWALDF